MTNIPELKPLSMTARQMRDAGACYDLQTIKGLWDGRESLTALDILDLGIPDADKLWGVLRENLIPASGLRELACRFAETALVGEVAAGGAPDARSYAVIEVARAFANGDATEDQLAAASSAASSAAWAAESSAAWAAARAENSATWAAASSAAAAAEINIIREYLQKFALDREATK